MGPFFFFFSTLVSPTTGRYRRRRRPSDGFTESLVFVYFHKGIYGGRFTGRIKSFFDRKLTDSTT